jgi:hypothetical protein
VTSARSKALLIIAMNINKVIHTTRIYFIILILLIFQNTAFCQGGEYGYGLLIDGLMNYKAYREQRSGFERRIKAMTTSRGNAYATHLNDNRIRGVNSHYDEEVQKALAKYSRAFRNSKSEGQKGELYVAKRYKIYIDKISEIELKRNRDLLQLEQQYSKFIRIYSPYWARNDLYD